MTFSIAARCPRGGMVGRRRRLDRRAGRRRHLSLRGARPVEAGQAAGDKRGRQSAAVVVYATEAYAYLDLRVDEHHDPVAELRRIFEVAKRRLLPFVRMMPTREDVLGGRDEQVEQCILLSVPQEREAR